MRREQIHGFTGSFGIHTVLSVLHFPGQRPGLLDTCGDAKDGSAADPSIDAASVIADQEPLALSRFDQMQVLAPATSHEDNVADGGIALAKRYDRDMVAIVDLAGHGMPTRSHDDCLASRELLYRGAGPTHGC